MTKVRRGASIRVWRQALRHEAGGLQLVCEVGSVNECGRGGPDMETVVVGSIALIAAGQGDLRDALRAMLHSMPGVSVVEVDDTASAIAALGREHPDVVVIDSALPGNHCMELIEAIQLRRPRIRSAILVDNVWQQAAAMRAGADRAPLKGEPAARLFLQVEQLLSGTQRAVA